MARRDNPFALLGEDDDGSDVTALIAKVEAKISTAPAPPPAEQPKPKAGADALPSKPLPPSEYVRTERGRGRGGRVRGMGRGVFRSRGGGAGDEADGQFGNGNARVFDGDSNGRGRGRGGGRGGRGRGRGRGFYEDRGFGNENQNNGLNENQGQGGDGLEERGEVQGRSYGSGEYRPPRYENGKFGEEGRNSDWVEKGYSGDGRGFRGGERRGGRGYSRRGSRGGEGRRYGGRDGTWNVSENKEAPADGTWNVSENKEAPADGTEQAVNDAPSGDGATGCLYMKLWLSEDDQLQRIADILFERQRSEFQRLHDRLTCIEQRITTHIERRPAEPTTVRASSSVFTSRSTPFRSWQPDLDESQSRSTRS